MLAGSSSLTALRDAFYFARLSEDIVPFHEETESLVRRMTDNPLWQYQTEWLLLSARASDRKSAALAWSILLKVADNDRAKPENRNAATSAIEETRNTGGPPLIALIEAIRSSENRDYMNLLEVASNHVTTEISEPAKKALAYLKNDGETAGKLIGEMKIPRVIVSLSEYPEPDLEKGKSIYVRDCRGCHFKKAPSLTDISMTYGDAVCLANEILNPDLKIAAGFSTMTYQLSSGKSYTGFVGKESSDGRLEIIDHALNSVSIHKEEIKRRSITRVSTMPTDVVDHLTVEEFADLLGYLLSL